MRVWISKHSLSPLLVVWGNTGIVSRQHVVPPCPA
jgi:hypothetical protein